MKLKIAVVGGGPAGLRAAEVCVRGGADVRLFEAKRSVGRKFLVAGRGGLNLTRRESSETFAIRYSPTSAPPDFWTRSLAEFGPAETEAWAAELGIECFAASTGRVYPRDMKSAPLLRRWIMRLRELGVRFSVQHEWTGIEAGPPLRLGFSAPDGPAFETADAVILALGGGSWPETGSNGNWIKLLTAHGVAVAPLSPANCGWECPWPAGFLAQTDGQPLKNVAVRAGDAEAVGELLITQYGLEGGAIYQLGSILRDQSEPELIIDLKPSLTVGQLVRKIGTPGRHLLAEARARWRLSPAAHALLALTPGAASASAIALADAVKNCRVRLTKPRPIAEAISTAGGIRWSELDEHLELRKLPGVFAAGEMIDWEAPTGGYLIQGCLATGSIAARGALTKFPAP